MEGGERQEGGGGCACPKGTYGTAALPPGVGRPGVSGHGWGGVGVLSVYSKFGGQNQLPHVEKGIQAGQVLGSPTLWDGCISPGEGASCGTGELTWNLRTGDPVGCKLG